MKKIILLSLGIITALASLSSCDDSNEEKVFISENGFHIEFGQICGWCHGQEQMIITESGYSYEYDYACGDSLDIDQKQFKTSTELWYKLTNLIDLEAFSHVDINTCNYCADGCDYWLIISDSAFSHKIRFINPDNISHAMTQSLSKELIQLLEDRRTALEAF